MGDKLKGLIEQTAEGIRYFGKLRKGRSPQMERMEEAVEGPASPVSRFGHPRTDEERRERHKSLYGTEELPPRGTGRQREIRDRGRGGSRPWSDAELRKGYRKVE